MRIFSRPIGAALAIAMAVGSLTPTVAAPLVAPKAMASSSDIVPVQSRKGFYRRGNDAYYNGQRGFREQRKGYRRYNGYWFPPGAFIAGAILGGVLGQQPARAGNRHVRWCYEHYNSYRVSDNTWKPRGAPRRSCNSPFD